MQEEKFRELLTKYNEGRCSPEEIAWLESAYLNWNESDKLSLSEEQLTRARDLMWNTLEQRTKPVVISRLWPRIAVAASVLICLSIGLIYYKYARSYSPQGTTIVVTSKAGEKKSLTLPDGTFVVLNGESKISYLQDFNIKVRKVDLTGEAYFTVIHNQRKPFIVHTPKMDVKDIGTIFNVKAYPNDKYTEASLIKGAIELIIADKKIAPILIHPGEKVLVNNFIQKPGSVSVVNNLKINSKNTYQVTKITTNPIVKTVVETDWVRNRLTFNDESFDDMAGNMERWYDVKISFENPSIKKYRFVATFNNQSLTQVLDVLKLTRDFNYRKEGNVIIIY